MLPSTIGNLIKRNHRVSRLSHVDLILQFENEMSANKSVLTDLAVSRASRSDYSKLASVDSAYHLKLQEPRDDTVPTLPTGLVGGFRKYSAIHTCKLETI